MAAFEDLLKAFEDMRALTGDVPIEPVRDEHMCSVYTPQTYTGSDATSHRPYISPEAVRQVEEGGGEVNEMGLDGA